MPSENNDDTQPRGPNESGYGDKLPQQMVKSMQKDIESRYVGCDDETMNDIKTQANDLMSLDMVTNFNKWLTQCKILNQNMLYVMMR